MSLPLGPRRSSKKNDPRLSEEKLPIRAESVTGRLDLLILRTNFENINEIKPSDEPPDVAWSWMTFWSYTGPGFLIAIAYLDPGNLEADLQAGSYTKYQFTWLLFATTIIGLLLQAMGARIGIVTGKHLAELCREEYSRKRSIGLWIMSEISIIASDIQAVVCSAIALNILFNLPLWIGCIITVIDTFTFLMLHVFGVRSLELFFVLLVGMMAICFFWNFTLNPPEAKELMEGLVPRIPSYGLRTAVGIIGSVILPQNYYVHSAVVLSRDIDRDNPTKVREANKYLFADAALALSIAFVINLAVVGCFAELFFDQECANASTVSACLEMESVNTHHATYGNCTMGGQKGACQQIGLRDADAALGAALGGTASLIWALGLLASGQSSTMTITYAGQFITEGFGGFMLPVHWRVLMCRTISLIPALIAAVYETSHPAVMDELTQWGNVITACCVPFAILPMLKFCTSTKIMGEHTLHRYFSRFLWPVAGFLIFLNLAVIWETMYIVGGISFFKSLLTKLGLVTFTFFYLYFSYLMVDDEINETVYNIWIVLQSYCCRMKQPKLRPVRSTGNTVWCFDSGDESDLRGLLNENGNNVLEAEMVVTSMEAENQQLKSDVSVHSTYHHANNIDHDPKYNKSYINCDTTNNYNKSNHSSTISTTLNTNHLHHQQHQHREIDTENNHHQNPILFNNNSGSSEDLADFSIHQKNPYSNINHRESTTSNTSNSSILSTTASTKSTTSEDSPKVTYFNSWWKYLTKKKTEKDSNSNLLK